jgi:hypothetical protein
MQHVTILNLITLYKTPSLGSVEPENNAVHVVSLIGVSRDKYCMSKDKQCGELNLIRLEILISCRVTTVSHLTRLEDRLASPTSPSS